MCLYSNIKEIVCVVAVEILLVFYIAPLGHIGISGPYYILVLGKYGAKFTLSDVGLVFNWKELLRCSQLILGERLATILSL